MDEAVFVFIALFASVFGIIYYYLQSRHKERMSLIENGADAKLFQTGTRKKPYFFAMLLGILFISIALGIGVGYWINESMDSFRRHDEAPYFISIFFFVGIGFIGAYILHKKELEKQD